MTRGALIELLYHRSLLVSSSKYDDASAVTLMSNDVDNLEGTGEMLHETWAQMVEVVIGTCLLAKQIGWLCLVPLFIIFRKSTCKYLISLTWSKRFQSALE
jgi:ATP-binding cassette, subfamily C (CFTR/MRP), member 1